MLLIGTKLCKRRRRPFFRLSLYPLSICHVIFFSPSLRNFYNRQISMPLCSCPLATWNAGKKKKCPDEYTASQEDLLIGGSLSPCVVELRTNPFPQLNETTNSPWWPTSTAAGVGGENEKWKGKESIQGLLPLSTLPGVILTKAETQAGHVCCDH